MAVLRRSKYKKPDLPSGQFMLAQGDIEEGPFIADQFVRDPDEGYWYATTAGRPYFLRVLKQDGNNLQLIDGGGDEYEVRIVRWPVS